MLRATLMSLIGIAFLSVSGRCQDITYDTLTLDDGIGPIPSLKMVHGFSGSTSDYEIQAIGAGLSFKMPGQLASAFLMRRGTPLGTMAFDKLGVGIGTLSPVAPLHVSGRGGLPSSNNPFPHPWVLVNDVSQDTAHRVQLVLANNGGTGTRYENTGTGHSWQTSVLNNGDFRISLDGSGGHEFRMLRNGRLIIGPGNKNVFDLRPNGNLIIGGTLVQSSDRNKKENFSDVDCQEILKQVRQLPIQSWNYKSDEDSIRHIGPMAQDFFESFQVGHDNKTISTVDTAGVTIAAIKALTERNKVLTEENESIRLNIKRFELQNRQLVEIVEELEQRMSVLELSK